MNRLALALGALVATSMAPALAVTPAVWNGFYIGANAGYGWGTLDDHPEPFYPQQWGGGIHGGFNYGTLNNWVFGVEADWTFAHLNDSYITGSGGGARLREGEILDYGTIRARVGRTDDMYFVYFTGGAAWANTEFTRTRISTGEVEFNGKSSTWGWALGLGVERVISDRLSVRFEYLHLDFDDLQANVPNFNDIHNMTVDTVRVGLTLKLF